MTTELQDDVIKYGSHLNAIMHYCDFEPTETIKIKALANDLITQVNNLAYPLFKADAMDRLEQIATLTN